MYRSETSTKVSGLCFGSYQAALQVLISGGVAVRGGSEGWHYWCISWTLLVPVFEKQTLRVRLFENKITTFDIGTEQLLEFQNLLEITASFCVTRIVFTFRLGLWPRRSQSVGPLSKWHAYKFILRTQTQPSGIHQLGVKNTPHLWHRHAATNYVTKWVGFNWKNRYFPPLAFLRGHWLKTRHTYPTEV
jgi:hypothetical protein